MAPAELRSCQDVAVCLRSSAQVEWPEAGDPERIETVDALPFGEDSLEVGKRFIRRRRRDGLAGQYVGGIAREDCDTFRPAELDASVDHRLRSRGRRGTARCGRWRPVRRRSTATACASDI